MAYREVAVECCAQLMTVGEALIHLANKHGLVQVVIQQLHTADQAA